MDQVQTYLPSFEDFRTFWEGEGVLSSERRIEIIKGNLLKRRKPY
jgi:hypothetical protein